MQKNHLILKMLQLSLKINYNMIERVKRLLLQFPDNFDGMFSEAENFII